MRAAIAAACAVLLAACTTATAPVPPPDDGTDALAQVGRWILRGATNTQGDRIDAAFPGGTAVHALVFNEGNLSIEGGCNRIGGNYRIDAQGRLVAGPLHSTRMACAAPGLMEADTAVSALVDGAAEWRIAESWPEQLYFDHADGSRSYWIADHQASQ